MNEIKATQTPVTRIALVVDRSSSINSYGLTDAIIDNVNSNIRTIQQMALERAHEQKTTVSLYTFGSDVREEFFDRAPSELTIWSRYNYRPQGNTALLDGIGRALTRFEAMPDANEAHVSFLVLVITDGEENQSYEFKNPIKFSYLLSRLQNTGRYSVAVLVPRGHKANLCRNFGVPEGNIAEWEQTSHGAAQATQHSQTGLRSYMTQRSTGQTGTKSFFVDLSNVSTADVKATLVDVSDQVNVLHVDRHNELIKDFCARKTGAVYQPGTAYYELAKAEKEVQPYKQFFISDRTTGKVYGGDAARAMLNLPNSGTIRLRPGMQGKWDVFVESTSYTRKLQSGTRVIYTGKMGNVPAQGTLVPSPAPVPAATRFVSPVKTQPVARATGNKPRTCQGCRKRRLLVKPPYCRECSNMYCFVITS